MRGVKAIKRKTADAKLGANSPSHDNDLRALPTYHVLRPGPHFEEDSQHCDHESVTKPRPTSLRYRERLKTMRIRK